jgi:hypothetical protein
LGATRRVLSTAVQQEETTEVKTGTNKKVQPSRHLTNHHTFELYTHPSFTNTFLKSNNTNQRHQTTLRTIMNEGVTSNSKLMQPFIEQSSIEVSTIVTIMMLYHLIVPLGNAF